VFRKRYPVESLAGLDQFRASHADRPCMQSTYPAE
jgi:hypothetical protein